MTGSLGDSRRFGVYINSQQHYAGPVFSYSFSPAWTLRFEPAFGLTGVSDPFLLRSGLSCMFGAGKAATEQEREKRAPRAI